MSEATPSKDFYVYEITLDRALLEECMTGKITDEAWWWYCEQLSDHFDQLGVLGIGGKNAHDLIQGFTQLNNTSTDHHEQ